MTGCADDEGMKTNDFQAKIDSQLADLYGQASKQRAYLASATQSITKYTARYGADHPNTRSAVESAERAKVALAAIREQEKPLEAIYSAQPWSRFFLCTAHGGHIHSSLNCSTTYMSTEFAWLPSLSGLTEAEAVAEYGAILCTVCYPSAPVEWTGGVNKKDAAKREARDTERAAKADAKAAKAITNPDGTPLRTRYAEIKTIVTANRELVDALTQLIDWNTNNRDLVNFASVTGEYQADADKIAAAIAHKTGTPVETVLAEAQVKAAKKYDTQIRRYR